MVQSSEMPLFYYNRINTMTDELLSLKWNNHKSTFADILTILRDQEVFIDVTLACGGKQYPAHKFVLSTCSDYFKEMFTKNPCKHPIVFMKDVSARDLEALLDFMYRGEVNVPHHNLASLIKTAEGLQVKGLAVPDDPVQLRKADRSGHREADRSSHRDVSTPRPPPEPSVSPTPKRKRTREVEYGGGGKGVVGVVDAWTPGPYTALKALLSARLCAAIWGLINDCDETYNYWEPTHYLLYGKGFQTWEYSPQYALRSYTYLLLHAVPGWLYSTLLQSNRILVFFFIRCMLALGCSGCELYFYRGVCKEFGSNIGLVTLGVLVFAAGMFTASTAFLPSSFAMYMTLLSIGAWYHQAPQLAIFTTAISTFLGWPFAAALGIPIAYDILFRKKQVMMFTKWCIISALTILVPMVQIDSQYFGRLVVAPLNIVLYNIFSSHGPNIYGTEPWTFYIINGFLNFNIMFLAALVALPFHILVTQVLQVIPKRSTIQHLPLWLSLSPLYLWLTVFLLQPHKEERFLFPIYPLICLTAAVATDTMQQVWWWAWGGRQQHYISHTTWLSLSLLALSATMSMSRIVGQYRAFHAPIETFMELNRLASEGHYPSDRPITLCLGREWHRFPSSFFLPGLNWDVQFIESEFRGQLPQPYSQEPNATSTIPDHMNDANLEETTRYVNVSLCHLLVDMDREEETPREPRYAARTTDWTTIHSLPFMDGDRSQRLLRAFYIPFLTEQYSTYLNYTLLEATRWRTKTRTTGH